MTNNRGNVVVGVVIGLLLVLLVGGVWYYVMSNNTTSEQNQITQTNPQPQSLHPATPQPPTPATPSLPTTCKDEAEATPVITSLSTYSGPLGTFVDIKGCNFSGFEGDKIAIIENSQGVSAPIAGDPPSTSKVLTITLRSPLCTTNNTYSGLPCKQWLTLSPGVYKIYTVPWGKKSNMVTFTVTPTKENAIIKNDWGVSFAKTSDWNVTSNTNKDITLTQVSGGWVGDIIDMSYVSGKSITNTDAKFGLVTYYYDENSQQWMKIGQNQASGATEPAAVAIPDVSYPYTTDGLPVFIGTGRWLTYIVPLAHSTFLQLNITGSGQTQPLKDLLRTLKKI